MITNPIGCKVYLLEKKGIGYLLNKSVEYEIVSVKDFNECNDHCRHYVVKPQNGHTQEVREYICVFVPDTKLSECEMVTKFLSDNSCYPSDVSFDADHCVAVNLEWSDWKHGHIWCDTLMRYIGYSCDNEVVTEENGSDCYSSIHYFSKESEK